MKHQTPNTKHQKNLKSQTSNAARGGGTVFSYPDPPVSVLWLKEDSAATESSRHPFDLEERTARFGEAIVRFSKQIPRGPANDRLIDQLVGCGTSIGANYCEANGSVSKKDFRFSIRHNSSFAWSRHPRLNWWRKRALYREASELHLIFASMFRKTK